jgi:hypothetical protein
MTGLFGLSSSHTTTLGPWATAARSSRSLASASGAGASAITKRACLQAS